MSSDLRREIGLHHGGIVTPILRSLAYSLLVLAALVAQAPPAPVRAPKSAAAAGQAPITQSKTTGSPATNVQAPPKSSSGNSPKKAPAKAIQHTLTENQQAQLRGLWKLGEDIITISFAAGKPEVGASLSRITNTAVINGGLSFLRSEGTGTASLKCTARAKGYYHLEVGCPMANETNSSAALRTADRLGFNSIQPDIGPYAIEFVDVGAGEFQMGSDLWSPRERPAHNVAITRPFQLGKHEITQAQWRTVMGGTPPSLSDGNRPIENVSFEEVAAFIAKLNARGDGWTYGLPSDSEWEYAARAGGKDDDVFSDTVKKTTQRRVRRASIQEDASQAGAGSPSGYYQSSTVGRNRTEADALAEAELRPGKWIEQSRDLDLDRMLVIHTEVQVVAHWSKKILTPWLSSRAWFLDNASNTTHAVGQKSANVWGFYDMHGNVNEWCANGIVRGGSFRSRGNALRSTNRSSGSKAQDDLGFRLYRTRVDAGTSTDAALSKATPELSRRELIEFANIPAGTFMMGSNLGDNDEKPVHAVTISKAFEIGRYEVTQAQWQAVMLSNPSRYKDCGDSCPVELVSWDDAQEFLDRLNEWEDGYTYRLPTEAEWEYAARAGRSDEALPSWYKGNSLEKTHPVGEKDPNAWGLYDMNGNVAEWCADFYGPYLSASATDPVGAPAKGEAYGRPVMRGCSYGSDAKDCRPEFRLYDDRDKKYKNVGFRLVRVRL